MLETCKRGKFGTLLPASRKKNECYMPGDAGNHGSRQGRAQPRSLPPHLMPRPRCGRIRLIPAELTDGRGQPIRYNDVEFKKESAAAEYKARTRFR